MTYEQWIKTYKDAMDLLSLIDNTCPFAHDIHVDCYGCKIQDECNYVIKIGNLRPK